MLEYNNITQYTKVLDINHPCMKILTDFTVHFRYRLTITHNTLINTIEITFSLPHGYIQQIRYQGVKLNNERLDIASIVLDDYRETDINLEENILSEIHKQLSIVNIKTILGFTKADIMSIPHYPTIPDMNTIEYTINHDYYKPL